MRTLALLAVFLASAAAPAHAAAPARERRAPRRGLIHPLLDTADVEFSELRPFKHRLERLRSRLIREKKVRVMALYFRDLDNGLAFGIGQDNAFRPASLMKLPLMLALLKKQENDPGLLQRTKPLVPLPSPPLLLHYPPSRKLQAGRTYSIDELLTAMIARSDNDASGALLGALTERDLARVFEDLGLRIPDVRAEHEPMTVREYAAFFRILYNASYLTKEHSQKALEYLAAAELATGLRAGVPAEVTVARKFGESADESGEPQFHDCGIVYHAVKPYVLCVMTRGRDMAALAAAVGEASRLTYEAVEASVRPARNGKNNGNKGTGTQPTPR